MQNRKSRPKNHARAVVQLRLLGPFQILVHGQKVSLSARKARAMLAYLAVRVDEDIPRETLAGLLWGDRGPDQARASLRQSLAALRKALGDAADGVLFASHETVRLAGDLISVDRHAIGAIPDDASAEDRAAIAAQYRGAFLEGFALDAPEFDYWLSAERAAVRGQVSSLLRRLVADCEGAARYEDAIGHATRLLTLDPLQEDIHRKLMQLFAGQGRYDAALTQFEQCQRALGDELDVAPDPATLDLVQQIRAERRAKSAKRDRPATPPGPAGNGADRRGATGPAPGPPNDPSIAVLPFANLSGDPEQEYFSDGITGDIITELSKFRTLFVIARHSSFVFKGATVDLKEIAEKLGVQYIVEGSVRRAGDTVRITVQLIEAATGGSLWGERYDRRLDDIFAVQDEVTRSIVAVLPGRVQDSVADRAARNPTSDMRAYEYMLQGKHLRDGLNATDTARARVVLKKALDLDPGYARAYMYLADTYVIDLWLGLADKGASKISLDLSRKGAGLDNTDVYIQDQLGFALLCEGLWEDAEIQFSRTLARIVNEAESMAWCGYAFLLLGHHRKALDVVVEAVRLDPLHAPSLDWVLGLVQFFAGNYAGAVRALIGEALLNSVAHAFLTSAYAHLGKMDEARAALKTFIAVRHAEFADRNLDVAGDTIDSLAGSYRAMWRRSADWELLVDGLRKAGLSD